MKTTILVFGQLTDITNTEKIIVENISNTDGILEYLIQHFPDLKNAKFLMALDKEIVQDNLQLLGENTIGLLPPFSGG